MGGDIVSFKARLKKLDGFKKDDCHGCIRIQEQCKIARYIGDCNVCELNNIDNACSYEYHMYCSKYKKSCTGLVLSYDLWRYGR